MPEGAPGLRVRVAWALTGVLLALLAAGSLLVAHAEFELYLASDRLDRWWRDRDPVLLDQAEKQLARAGFALHRGTLHERRGELALVRSFGSPAPGQWIERAEREYTHAIVARPAWPEGWVHRAVVRARRADTAGMREDLRTALRLGPNTGMILAILAPHAGVVTARLAPVDRDALAALAVRLARFRPDLAAGFVRRLGLLPEWCRLLDGVDRPERWCPAAAPDDNA